MILVWRASSIAYKVIPIVILGLISFGLNYYWVHRAEPGFNETIFFLTPFRVFEFTIGALGIFIVGSRLLKSNYQEVLAVIGVALILASVLYLNSESIFPYANALAPCVGALFIIITPNSKLNKWLFGNKLAIGIGLISYSLYLVHWPVFVFAKYSWLNVSSFLSIAAMLLATVLLSLFVYYFIERPYRKPNGIYFFTCIAIICIFLCVLGWSMKVFSGWQWRFHSAAMPTKTNILRENNADALSQSKVFFSVEQIESGKAKRFQDYSHACHIAQLNDESACNMEKPVQILVFGNSHEPDGFNMLNALYQDNPKVNLIVFDTVNDCAIEFKQGQFSSPTVVRDCSRRFAILNSSEFLKKITHIFYNSHFSLDYTAKDLWEVMDIISRKNGAIKIVAVGSYVATTIDCATLINKSGSVDACKAKEAVNYFYPNEHEISVLPQVKSMNYLYISKYELLCKNLQLESCVTHSIDEPMFYDQHHLSYSFARRLGQLMWVRYGDALIQYGLPRPDSTKLVSP